MKFKSILILTLILILFYSCTDNNTTEPIDPGEKMVYRIGVLIPMTGAGALNGEQSKASVQYAIDDINKYFSDNNINTVISAVFRDSGTDTAQAMQMMQQFADSGIKIVVGPYSSTVLSHIKDFADANDILLVSHSAVASSLALKGDNVFRMAPSDKWQGKALGDLMKDDSKLIVIPLVRDDVWGKGLYDDVRDVLDVSAIALQTPNFYSPTQTNFSAVVQKINSDIEDLQVSFLESEIAVLMITYSEGTEIMRQSSFFEYISSTKFYGGSAFAQNSKLTNNGTAAGTAVTTLLECPIMGFNESYKDKYQPLQQKLRTDLGFEPDIYALTIYDAAYLAGLTLNAVSDTVSINTIKTGYLTQAQSYTGMTGKVEFDTNDDRINVLYDFWSVEDKGATYGWKTTAVYDTKTGQITRK